MTSFDFLSGFNNIDPKFILDAIDLMQTVEASDAEKEIMNMENYTIHKKRPVRRSVLVAAAVIALFVRHVRGGLRGESVWYQRRCDGQTDRFRQLCER